MKFLAVSVLAYALVAQADVLPIIPQVGKVGHAVAAGVATSVGLGAAATVHAAVHGAKKVGEAVVGTGLGALELGSGVASGLKNGISNGIHGSSLGFDERSGRPGVIDRLEKPWKEGPVDNTNESMKTEYGGVIVDKLHNDFHKHDKRDDGFEYGSHEHNALKRHVHGIHHDWRRHVLVKRDSRKRSQQK